MTPEELVQGIKGPVGKIGGAWMFDAAVTERGAELGLDPWSWYHVGRGGVLGATDPAVVGATFAFFPPELQAKAYAKGVSVLGAVNGSAEYAKACAAWGLGRFPADGSGRLADLLTRALDTASPLGLPLFAGWRTVLAGFADAPGASRLALALQAAREHRGSAHVVAVAAAGIEPLQAVVSGRYGTANAEFFGWVPPYPDPEAGRAAMQQAEAVTDAMVTPAFAVLSGDERAELHAGLRAL